MQTVSGHTGCVSNRSLVTQEFLIERYAYARDGWLWLRLKSETRRAGYVAPNGYVCVSVLGDGWLAHRLVFLYHHGWLPEYVDHLNRDRSDNRIANLRAATRDENRRNTSARGCYFNRHTRTNPWFASIKVNGRAHYLGRFATEQEAHAAYLAAKSIYHPGAA